MDSVYWHFKGLPTDEAGLPLPFSGDNLVVSFAEINSILEMDSPRLFDDNYYFVNDVTRQHSNTKDVNIIIKRVIE